MLNQFINISVLTIDKGSDTIQFQIDITNGTTAISQDFHSYADNFKEFSTGLLSFPKTIKDNLKYELGERRDGCATYILMDVFCYKSNGHSAIRVVVGNNEIRPYTNKCEFYITTVPASLNKLGQLLRDWNPYKEKEIMWTAE